jgi:methylated-DNA-[protein]-cysteine S-methyltransferase
VNVTLPFLSPPSPESRPENRWWDQIVLELGGRTVELLVVSDGEAIVGTFFASQKAADPARRTGRAWVRDPSGLAAATAQLRAYAAGELTDFDLPLRPTGTPFQLAVWASLSRIPYGVTTTYGRIADGLGRPTGGRAVGAAVGANPIGIIVPCHRVIGADGSLTGYAGGLDNKVSLLRLEGVAAL